MSLTRSFRFLRICNSPARCLFSTESGSSKDTTKGTAPPPPPPPAKKVASTPVDDNTKYLCPEYYEHDTFSFYEIESSITNRRVGQPSAKVK